jgi:CheY-like chemotaxis protein
MERARILVVDDKENIVKLFARILGDGYELTTAADGGRAISLVASQPFDVVVTDLRMPGADGFEVLRAVKARASRRSPLLRPGRKPCRRPSCARSSSRGQPLSGTPS